jgi:hypothetical protein
MKTLIVLFAPIAFATIAVAQNRIIVLPTKDSTLNVDDRFWNVKALTTAVTTKNGTLISPDGTVKTTDGKITQLKNGDYVDVAGNVATLYMDPVPTTGFAMNDGKLLLITAPMKMANEECIRKDDGKFWMVKFMTNIITTKTGFSIMLDGTVKSEDGKTFQLQDNDGLDENGNEIKVDVTSTKPMNCMYKHNGRMMCMTELKKDTTLKTGLIVRTDGTIKDTNGRITNISDGGLIPMDGSYLINRTEDK